MFLSTTLPSLKQVIWKKSVFNFYLQNNSAMIIPKFQRKLLYIMTLSYTCSLFSANFSFWRSFYIFLQIKCFFKKLKTSLEACFFQPHFYFFTQSSYKVRTRRFLKAPWWEQNHRTLGAYLNDNYTNGI